MGFFQKGRKKVGKGHHLVGTQEVVLVVVSLASKHWGSSKVKWEYKFF